jgi:hypothetical protein
MTIPRWQYQRHNNTDLYNAIWETFLCTKRCYFCKDQIESFSSFLKLLSSSHARIGVISFVDIIITAILKYDNMKSSRFEDDKNSALFLFSW